MFKTIKTLFIVIWLIDMLNINFMINGVAVAAFLDKTIPINTLFWFLFWLLIPTETKK